MLLPGTPRKQEQNVKTAEGWCCSDLKGGAAFSLQLPGIAEIFCFVRYLWEGMILNPKEILGIKYIILPGQKEQPAPVTNQKVVLVVLAFCSQNRFYWEIIEPQVAANGRQIVKRTQKMSVILPNGSPVFERMTAELIS